MEYVIEGNKVVFVKNNKHIWSETIRTDENFRLFVFVPNPDKNSKKWDDNISDAINQIRTGIGDQIKFNYVFPRFKDISIILYLDRSIGNAIKHATIEAWSGIQFGFSLIGYRREKNKSSWFTKDGNIGSATDEMFFAKTEKSARTLLNHWNAEAKKVAKALEEESDENKRTEIIDNCSDAVYQLSENYWFDKDLLSDSTYQYYVEYKLEIIQVIKE